jgi:peptide/nickel transport system permease protein
MSATTTTEAPQALPPTPPVAAATGAPEKRPPGLIRRLPTSGVAMVGLSLILFWVILALLAPYLGLYQPNRPNIESLGNPLPSAEHWLGLDNKGRDMLSRIIWGARKVLLVAPLAAACAYLVGCPLGLLAGYYGGKVDFIISRICDVILSFPIIVLYVILIATIGPSIINIIVAVILASSPGIARIVRGLALEQRHLDYVAAAQLRRENALYIMFVELLPNCRGPLITDFCLRVGYTIITIGILGFLGLGLPPPDPDWGSMVKEGTTMISLQPHMALFPAIAIVTLVLGFNLLADGLRELSLSD